MRYLKLYEQFRMLTEKVLNLNKIRSKSDNQLVKHFGGSEERISEFLATVFPNQNLQYLAAGGVGLTFKWLEDSESLPQEFYNFGLTGREYPITNKCIKITMSKTEADQTIKMVGKKIDGLCEYFWVKETEYNNDTFYLICMDLLRMPEMIDKMIIHLIFILSFANGPTGYFTKSIDQKLKLLLSWLKSDQPEYTEAEFDETLKDKIMMLLQKGLKKVTLIGQFCGRNDEFEGMEKTVEKTWKEMDEEYFLSKSKEVLEVYDVATHYNLNINDIHENNMGYRGNELVAFDFI